MPPFQVYFSRISKSGQRIGSEIRITDKFEKVYYPSLLWHHDHYVLFFFAEGAIRYVLLDSQGKSISSYSLLAKPDKKTGIHEGFEAALGPNGLGISWTVWEEPDGSIDNKYHLSFLEVNPDSGKHSPVTNVDENCADDSNCISDSFFLAPKPALFWTGKNYGLCWKNNRGEAMVSLFSPSSAKEVKRFRVLPRKILPGQGPVKVSPSETKNQPQIGQPELCAWNGSEIAVISTVRIGETEQFAWAKFDESGNQLGNLKYLNTQPCLSWAPQALNWNGSEYFFVMNRSLFVINQ